MGALLSLQGRKACLLAHHGMIVLERTPERALSLAIEVEALCAIYLLARTAGKLKDIGKADMARVVKLFASYGTPDFPDDELVRLPATHATAPGVTAGPRAPRR
jgi:L-fuculose-phosphate aldolase